MAASGYTRSGVRWTRVRSPGSSNGPGGANVVYDYGATEAYGLYRGTLSLTKLTGATIFAYWVSDPEAVCADIFAVQSAFSSDCMFAQFVTSYMT